MNIFKKRRTIYPISDCGVIWRGNYSDWLDPVEARYWQYHLLPMTWMILSDPPTPVDSKVTEGE